MKLRAGDYERSPESGILVPRRHGVLHERPRWMCGPAFFGGASSPATDPYFSSVKLLLHGDGANGSTTFTDNSGSPLTPTVNGAATISTAQSKFGGASMAFNGTDSFLSYTATSDWNFGSGAGTIEFWVRPASIGAIMRICGQESALGDVGNNLVRIQATGYVTAAFYNGSTFDAAFGSITALVANTWTHVAVSTDGANLRLFVGGVLNSTVAVSGAYNASPSPMSIGREGNYTSNYFSGYIDDFRFTKGVCRYTAAFTPPTAAFPNS